MTQKAPRDAIVRLVLTRAEHDALVEAASQSNLPTATWARSVLLKVAHDKSVDPLS